MFRNLAKAAIFMTAALAAGAGLHAQEKWPSRPITIIVPYPPGGALDGTVRPFALALQNRLGKPVVLDHKPGANEAIGVQALLKAPADGYTFLATSDAAVILAPLLNSKLPYKPQQDLVPVSQLTNGPVVFVVPEASPARNIKDFIALAKKSSEGGRELTYGSSGVGGTLHIAMASFSHDQKLKMTHVPYKGSADMLKEMASGLLDSAVAGAPSVRPLIEAKKIKALAVSSTNRLPMLPDVPTLKEEGIADFGTAFIGLFAREGTPKEIVEAMSEAARLSAADSQLRKQLDQVGAEAVGSTSQDFAALIKSKYATQQARLKSIDVDMR